VLGKNIRMRGRNYSEAADALNAYTKVFARPPASQHIHARNLSRFPFIVQNYFVAFYNTKHSEREKRAREVATKVQFF
jgi:hypothetical protein